jgi:hypothetical protein
MTIEKMKSVFIDVAIVAAGTLALYASYHYYQMGGSKLGILSGLICSFAVAVHFGSKYGKKNLETEG